MNRKNIDYPLALGITSLHGNDQGMYLPSVKHHDFISFALGLPANELFPIDKISAAITHVFESDRDALQYSQPCENLKNQIIKLMHYRGLKINTENLILASGAQQGISILTKLFLNHNAVMFTENFTYPGLLRAIAAYNPNIVTVATEADGMDVEAIKAHLNQNLRPAFIYCITSGHNPTGTSLSDDKKKYLAELAYNYEIPIIEDDPYGFLYYEQQSLPLYTYNPDWVFYIGSFSKILAPSLRTGWIIAPNLLNNILGNLRDAYNLNITSFSQKIVNAYLEKNSIMHHIESLRHAYRIRRDVMMESIKEFLPANAEFETPTHGLFIWLKLQGAIDTCKLLEQSMAKHNVAFIPGREFAANTEVVDAKSFLRLNFSYNASEIIRDGISRLAMIMYN